MQHKGATHWIVTANFTASGAVAYLREDGSWGQKLAESRLFADEEATKPLVALAQKTQQFTVSDPYGIDVHVGESGIEPVTKRESIRALGPTTPIRRPDSGRERLPV
ncbi:MAG TPA: DUF2849 domain-containing protein [Polyangiaceae bacterium]|nr:DUF2849 domain-containing protein [Polyangiaceae bacterium]